MSASEVPLARRLEDMKSTVGHCGGCERQKPSTLAGYGYCQSAPTFVTRARFVPDEQECWIPEPFRPRQRGG